MRKELILTVLSLIISVHVSSQGYSVEATGPEMNIPRKDHLAFYADQDKAVVIGGRSTGNVSAYSAEVFNRISNTWTIRTLPYSHAGSTVAYIDSGRYIIMGGGSNNSSFLWFTTIYDAINDTFYPGPTMLNNRSHFSSARLLNNTVLIAGGNLGMSTVTELYDIDSNRFVNTGPLLNERAYAMILPTTDGNAYVIGGLELSFNQNPVFPVEEYHESTNLFSTVSNHLIPNDPGWEVFWSSNVGMMYNNRLSDGRYVFLVQKDNGDTIRYRIMSFDPSSKLFSFINTTPQLPDYLYAISGQWRLTNNIVVDQSEDYIYIDAFNETINHKLLIINASTGDMAIPTSFNPYNHGINSASKFLFPNGEIAYTGGENDSLANSSSDDYTLIKPLASFGITEVLETGGWFYAYPNPVEGNKIYIEIPEMEIDNLCIVDLTGRVVKRIDTNGYGGEIVVTRGNLNSGVYLVVLHCNGIKSVTRLILE